MKSCRSLSTTRMRMANVCAVRWSDAKLTNGQRGVDALDARDV